MTALRKRTTLLSLLLLFAALALLAWVLRVVPLEDIAAVLTELSLWQILLLLLLNTGIVYLLGLRWWLILRAQGHQLPFRSITRYRLAAFGVSYFTPGPHFGGEPLQVHFLRQQHGLSGSSALASVALDKVIELLSNFGFLSLSLLLVLRSGVLGSEILAGAQLFSLLFLLLPVLYLLALRFDLKPLSPLMARLPERWALAAQSTEDQLSELLRQRQGLLWQTLAASLLLWSALLFEYWLALLFLGLKLDPLQLLAIVVAARVAMFAPTPGALGALEASQVFAMQALGFDPAIGLSLSLLIRARDILFGGIGLWLGSRTRKQQ